MTTLTREELRRLYEVVLDRSQVAADPKLYQAIADKIAAIIAEMSAVRERGAQVFEWRLPLSIERYRVRGPKAGQKMTVVLCPSLNVYARMQVGQKARLSKELDVLIMAEMHKWPAWRHGGRQRYVRLTRHSSHELDEVSVDVIGGKCPIDRLVAAGVLRGDAQGDLQREANWERAKPGQGSLLIEVFEVI